MKLAWRSHKLRVVIIALFIVGVIVVSLVVALAHSWNLAAPKAPQTTAKTTDPVVIAPKPAPKTASFDKNKYSHTDPASLWVVVNKQHPMNPKDYVPGDITLGQGGYQYSSRINADLTALINAAAQQGVTLTINSAYRSYASQTALFNNYVTQYGLATAESISAHPGYSEHQTGLAVDIGGTSNPNCNLNTCFGDTAEGKWLAAHANDFGFVVRYQKETTDLTGYAYEPWHIRYVGRELAVEYKKEGAISLEAFFSVTGGAVYAN
jgi:D-alanyl-D-alanine carboxypeptidase